MIEMPTQLAFQRGFTDAMEGRASSALIFCATRDHDDYVLGFQQGVKNREQQQKEQQKQARQQWRTQPPAQGDLFGGGETG